MSHTYASIEDFKKFLIDGGEATWTDSDSEILGLLEAASRRIDGYCDRSRYGSGFGPRIATNRYDHDGSGVIDLRDDFLGFSGISMLDGTGGGTVTVAIDTDVYASPYGGPPYTELQFTGLGQGARMGFRVFTVAGTAGYSSETVSVGTATVGSASTSVSLSGGSAYAGETLQFLGEQLYITSSTGGTALTVVRAVNGTAGTAGTAAASVYRYPREVHGATLQLAARRHRSAQAGVQGDFGGGSLPIVGHRDSERGILLNSVGHLRRIAVG
jgi:hypothetical protein